jgi:hypothetical protein
MNFSRPPPPPAPEPYDPQAWSGRCCARLRKHYGDWATLDPHNTSERPAIQNMAQLMRLFHAVRSEHEG